MSQIRLCLFLSVAGLLRAGQQSDLESLLAASAHLRSLAKSDAEIGAFGALTPAQWKGYEASLRDWIETRLPSDRSALEARFPSIETQLTSELLNAGILKRGENEKPGFVSYLKFSRPDGLSDVLEVQTGVAVPCGVDGSLYLYRITDTSHIRILESHGTSDWGSNLVETQISSPDGAGNRLVFASWDSVQCASVWNMLDYRLYRIGVAEEPAVLLFSGSHSYTIEGDLHVTFLPQELLLEFIAEALEGGFRRTYVLHYSVRPDGVRRIDPLALQPQDFVHEWLLQPWSEMESRTSESAAKWHNFLHGVGSEYQFVQPCAERPGMTQIALNIDHIGEQEMPEPLAVYLLVQDSGDYHFKMSEVSFDRQSGCPGETPADYANLPSLFEKK